MSEAIAFGLIADPPEQVEPALRTLFDSVSHILVAGDIADPERLKALEAIAPVIAVRGDDDDHAGWTSCRGALSCGWPAGAS